MRSVVVTTLFLLFAACGGGDDGNEPEPDASPAGAADASPQLNCPAVPCVGETICQAGECVNAFGRIWTITIVSGTVPERKTNGDTWDAAGGLPDAFVQVQLNDQDILVTVVDQDTLSPSWNHPVDVNIPAGSKINWFAWDDDISDPDFIFGCGFDPLPATVLQDGSTMCDDGNGGTLLIGFTPN